MADLPDRLPLQSDWLADRRLDERERLGEKPPPSWGETARQAARVFAISAPILFVVIFAMLRLA